MSAKSETGAFEGLSNAEEARQATEEFMQERVRERREALKIKREIEQQRESERETIMVELPEGHEIEMWEMRGIGEQARYGARIQKAERRGEEARITEILNEMVQHLADAAVQSDVFGRRFFDAYDIEEIKEINENWALASREGGTEGK